MPILRRMERSSARPVLHHFVPVDRDASRLRPEETRDAFEENRLADAAPSDDHGGEGFLHVDAELVENLASGKGEMNIARADHGPLPMTTHGAAGRSPPS